MVNEEKRKRFMEVAENRVQNIIHSLEIIDPMGRSNNYDYTEADIDLMIGAIRESTDSLEKSLKQRLLNPKTQKKSFSFNVENEVENNENEENNIEDYE